MIQIGAVVVLARLLSPRDYGLYGMVMAVAALAEMMRDVGLGAAAIQAGDLDAEQRSNLWWINAAAGLVVTTGVALASPWIATFFREPSLTPMLVVIALTFLLNSMASQYSASLQRDLRFKPLQVVSLGTQICSLALCVCLALAGWGPWALVAQSVFSSAVGLVALQRLAGWFPQRWSRNADVRKLLNFGLNYFAYDVALYVGNYVVNIVMGRNFGSVELGAYTRAGQLVSTPMGYVTAPVGSVAFASLSRVQDDREKLGRYVLIGQQTVGYIVALLCGGLTVLAPLVVPVVLGQGWERSIIFVQLVAVSTALGAVPVGGGWIFQARGRSDMQFKLTLCFTVVRVVAVIIAARYSVEAVLASTIVVSCLTWGVGNMFLLRTTGIAGGPISLGAVRVLLVTAPPAAVAMYFRSAVASSWPPLVDFLASGSLYVALVGLLAALPPVRRDLQAAWALLRRQ